ncbi:MAG: DUF459 domain-containing protein [Hyphomicrobiales bacterium]|nr:DUF459 domain-containing protein [Hyphomicrobiales bacterium]
MSIGRRVVLGCCRWSTACGVVLIRAAPVVLVIFALLLPANAQFWGNSNSWGGRQQQYNPYGGYGHDRQWDNWGYRQRERAAPSPRLRERVREADKERSQDYSHAPPATPREDATVKIVVMGDANADWLAYGLEDAFSEQPEIGIARKHRTASGLIRYDQRREVEWPQVAREIIAAEKPKFVIMMIGNNDRETIREKAPPPAPANAPPAQPPPPLPAPPPDLERQPVEQQHSHLTPAQARQAAYGPWEFQSEKWEEAYIKRIDATIAALKSGGVPVIWVGLPSQRDTDASANSSYLNEIYRGRAEKAGIAYVDIWDGFVDEEGKFSPQGPDYLGQTRRLRTNDGVYFTKFGARKLAHYVEREIERIGGNKSMPVALPVPDGSPPQAPNAKAAGPAQRPLAGPVVPLTDTRIAPEELVGGPAAATGASVTLTKGEPVAAPSGRADDFSWPRGAINVEPVAVEPTAPDTAAADAGVKTAKPAQRKSALDAYAQQKPAQRRTRPRLNPAPWAHERPNVSSFGSSSW